MKSKLMILGASGHGKVIADIARLSGYEKIEYLDDALNAPIPTIGTVADHTRFLASHDFIVAIGNNAIRERITKMLRAGNADLATLIHPAATIGSNVTIGEGTVIMAGAVINADASVGNGAIVNTCSSIDHDCTVGDFTHVSVGSRLAGTVTVGDRTMIGAGAVVINNRSICADCMIGAGAIVVENIKESGTYVGVPAKRK